MTVQQTSLEAYRIIQDGLGDKQRRVYNLLRKASTVNMDMTNMEIATALHWSINRVTPRVKELRVYGLVVHSQTRICTVTGYRAMAWKTRSVERV